jgi:lipopolysaccharide cholinephosphotransferase
MSLEQLMRPEVADDWGIKKLQNCILNIAEYIHEFCVENGIKYCVMGGTALGAVRHGGFIPWDDDLDIFMTPDNYEKFRRIFNTKGDKENYYLQEEGKSGDMVSSAKLRLNNTTLIEDIIQTWDIHHGVYVDIFLLHKIPERYMGKLWVNIWEKYIVIKGISIKAPLKGDVKFIPFYLFLRLFPKRFLVPYALKQIYKYRNSDSPYVCHLFGNLSFKTGVYPMSYFDPLKLVPFETVHLFAPSDCHNYLTQYYGDYMKIPNTNNIMSAQHALKWSVDTPFKKRKNGLFSDEKYFFG